ncbi:MAG: UDP-4-amino-4,6-dideoxy-N-acetyl-beta-L-altrosamine transaminase [Candidatus Omnitrophica bacterium]|nr:UDP-4-amino-4,6-dideoxy-N-acetyl-beta-L-altrosamine transaminase [Candidatus Omnitrophota bacterium]
MKKYYYGKQSIGKEDMQAAVDVLKSAFITQGPKVEEFEQKLCKYTGAKYAVVVSHGTAALHLCMLVVGAGIGDEIITSTNTFIASANCAIYTGAIPVLCDINSDTACINIEEIKRKITAKTKAIIPVHFAGQSCDMKAIQQLAKSRRQKVNGSKIYIIEDAAHAIGSEYRRKKVGSCEYSDMTVFSFHPVKTITTGEGGAITTNSKRIYEKLIMLRAHGVTRDPLKFKKVGVQKAENGRWYYEMQKLGYNYRLTDIQGALGVSQLRRLDKFVKKRRDLDQLYRKKMGIDKRYSFLEEKEYGKSAWHLFVLLINFDKILVSKQDFFEKMREKGIVLQVHYIPVHLQPYYREKFGYKKGDFPNSENYYNKAFSLPLYPDLEKEDIEYICSCIKKKL